MAAIALPEPGSELGPCLPTCEHTDCSENRRMAATDCARCGEPIGYRRPFYDISDQLLMTPWTALAHQDCELEAIERRGPE